MKITLDTATLSRELFKLQGIASSKSTMQILQNALLEAREDGTLSLYATDLDISVSTVVECQVHAPGRVTVKAKDLYDAVKGVRSETVSLEREDNLFVQFTAGTVKARLVGMDPDEYPQTQNADDVAFLPVKTTRLVHMIDRTLFSVSTDEGRPNLTGALLQATDDGRVRMVSTDGHRLSLAETSFGVELSDQPPELQQGIIVPRKGLAELRRTVDLTQEQVEFAINGSNAIFRYGNATLFIRLIDGTFPNFQQVVPQENQDRKALIDRNELVGRIKLVSLFASAKTHNLRLQFEDDTCTISAQDPDKGECEERIPINYSGPSVRAGFNYRYLLDVLGTIDGEQVSVEMIDTLSPTIINELEGDDGDESLFIVMPMRI